MEKIKTFVATRNWDRVPVPLWIVVASPLLAFAIGGRAFRLPHGRACDPRQPQFWLGLK